MSNIPVIANVTGLGEGFAKGKLIACIVRSLYKKSFKNIDAAFFGVHLF